MDETPTVDLDLPMKRGKKKQRQFGALIGVFATVAVFELGIALVLFYQHQQMQVAEAKANAEVFKKEMALQVRELAVEARESDVANTAKRMETREKTLGLEKQLLQSSQQSLQDTMALLEPQAAAEELMRKYLASYASIDLSKPKPCDNQKNAQYVAAEAMLDALYSAALEVSGNNKYTLFVEQRRGAGVRPAPEENCDQQKTPANGRSPADSSTPQDSDVDDRQDVGDDA